MVATESRTKVRSEPSRAWMLIPLTITFRPNAVRCAPVAKQPSASPCGPCPQSCSHFIDSAWCKRWDRRKGGARDRSRLWQFRCCGEMLGTWQNPPCFRKKSFPIEVAVSEGGVRGPDWTFAEASADGAQALRRAPPNRGRPAPKEPAFQRIKRHASIIQFRYRLAGGAHSKQILFDSLPKTPSCRASERPRRAAAAPLVIKGRACSDRRWNAQLRDRVGDRQRLWASMWSGETYWMRGTALV